jgi:hypothetical protein
MLRLAREKKRDKKKEGKRVHGLAGFPHEFHVFRVDGSGDVKKNCLFVWRDLTSVLNGCQTA